MWSSQPIRDGVSEALQHRRNGSKNAGPPTCTLIRVHIQSIEAFSKCSRNVPQATQIAHRDVLPLTTPLEFPSQLQSLSHRNRSAHRNLTTITSSTSIRINTALRKLPIQPCNAREPIDVARLLMVSLACETPHYSRADRFIS